MKKKILLCVMIMTALTGVIYPQNDGTPVGTVSQIEKKNGEIIIRSPTAGRDIMMGDLLYVRIDGKIVQLRTFYPMINLAKCRAEGNNRALWTRVTKGMPVYRYKTGIEDSPAIVDTHVYKIGEKGPAGGWIFYDKGSLKDGWRYLEASPADLHDEIEIPWYQEDFNVDKNTGANSYAVGSGQANTKKLLKSQGKGLYAAKICADYRGGGKSDWFLPSKDELNLMFVNLQNNKIGEFKGYCYWSSSEDHGDGEFLPYDVWIQFFDENNEGYQSYVVPDNEKLPSVRAARAF